MNTQQAESIFPRFQNEDKVPRKVHGIFREKKNRTIFFPT
jgi:hypothetical protein